MMSPKTRQDWLHCSRLHVIIECFDSNCVCYYGQFALDHTIKRAPTFVATVIKDHVLRAYYESTETSLGLGCLFDLGRIGCSPLCRK